MLILVHPWLNPPMKTWNETRDVLMAAQTCILAGHSCAIVALTNVKGSAFRRPGAKLLIRSDGSMTGNVSGGCLENDLRERAMECIASGQQKTVHYNTGSDEDIIWGLGLGCDGELDLLLVPVRDVAWINAMLDRMNRFEPFSLVWKIGNGPAGEPEIKDSRLGEVAPPECFIDKLEPPPEFIIVGAGDDAIPLTDLAVMNGFRVTVVDHRSGYLSAERFPKAHAILNLRPEQAAEKIPVGPRSMVVIKNHALEMDKKWATFFDATPVLYIGILGPTKRCAKILAHMTSGNEMRVFGPAGLDIGAEGAEQIAASIIAEMLAVWSGRNPNHLRHREGSIHA